MKIRAKDVLEAAKKSEHWFEIMKYGLTEAEAAAFAKIPNGVNRVEDWREKNGFPAANSSVVRGLILDLINPERGSS